MEVVNAIGRRKTSVARVYLKEGSGVIKVNNKDAKEYFPIPQLHLKLAQPFKLSETEGKYDLEINVNGGGFNGQVDAITLAVSRALLKVDPEYRSALKEYGLLTRDPRMVERKKPGQKKARKKFQFSKR